MEKIRRQDLDGAAAALRESVDEASGGSWVSASASAAAAASASFSRFRRRCGGSSVFDNVSATVDGCAL